MTAASTSPPCTSNIHPSPRPDAELARTEAVAMPEDQFWSLITTLHGSLDDSGYTRLTRQLEKLTPQQIIGFDARMTIALYQLDDQCRWRWITRHDPDHIGHVFDDDFLYFRTDTVSAGRKTWQSAVQNDTLPWGRTDAANADGEPLLYVGMNAAKKLGISNDDWMAMEAREFSLSYEMESNPAGWPPVSKQSRADGT